MKWVRLIEHHRVIMTRLVRKTAKKKKKKKRKDYIRAFEENYTFPYDLSIHFFKAAILRIFIKSFVIVDAELI
jgi:hypothetical protein